MAEKIKKSIPLAVFIVLVGLIIGAGFYSFWFQGFGEGAKAVTTTTFTPSVTVGNATPTVSAVSLTLPILTDNTTTTATCTATITDTNGDDTISSATATIYRTGFGAACSQNDNYCYVNNVCALDAADADDIRHATCTIPVWFVAEPTDAGSPHATDTWSCSVQGEDSGGLQHTAVDGTPPNLGTVAALIITSAVNYQTLAPGATSSTSTITTATTTGNTAIDASIQALDLVNGGNSIGGEQQKYATSSLGYGSGGIAASSTVFLSLELQGIKPTAHPSNATDIIYWRIGIPGGQTPLTYTGTTTVAAAAD